MPDRSAASEAPLTGLLRLGIATRAGRSYARDQYHRGALRVLRPHYFDGSGQVSYTVVNPGGAYLGADRYRIDLAVAAQASLLLTTQSATKVYRTPQGPAHQHTVVRLDADTVLESVPDQVIVYRDGSYRQTTDVVMAPTASYVATEIVTPGWAPDGSDFRYRELRMRTHVSVLAAGHPRVFAVDHLRLVPDARITGMGVMEGYSHLGQVLVADARVDDALVDAVDDLRAGWPALRAAVSRIGATFPTSDGDPVLSGFVLRALGCSTEELAALNSAVVNLLRARWHQQQPVDLRKY